MISITKWSPKEGKEFKDFQTLCDLNGYEGKWSTSTKERNTGSNFHIKIHSNNIEQEWHFYPKGVLAVVNYVPPQDQKDRDAEDFKKIDECLKGTKWESRLMSLQDVKGIGGRNRTLDGARYYKFDNDAEYFELAKELEKVDIVRIGRGLQVDLEQAYRDVFDTIKSSIEKNREWTEGPELLRKLTNLETINPKLLEKTNRQEHLDPCFGRFNEGKARIRKDCSEEDFVRYMFETAGVYNISKADQEKVDAKNRITMPDGWKPGDNIFARLEAVGVEYDIKLYEDFKKRLKIV